MRATSHEPEMPAPGQFVRHNPNNWTGRDTQTDAQVPESPVFRKNTNGQFESHEAAVH